ncbi:MAG TPA: hypothetical protein VFB19_05830 [Mycobacterium sp.]|nr:hypothetical protein [Mycobacterium sp.]
MSSTPEPSASQTPPPPTYSGAEQHHGHRLSAGVVALIIAVIVVIAGGITAAVVFTHKPNPPQPPPPSPGGQLVQPAEPAAHPAASGRHTPNESIEPTEGSTTQESLGSGNAVSLTNGVSLTPASGWTVANSGDAVAAVNKDDGTASLLVVVGTVKSTDVEAVLNDDIAQVTQKLGIANVKVSKTETGSVQSSNFQEVAKRGFQGDLSTQQGTQSVVGMFLEFLNTKTQNAAFVMFMAKDDKSFDAAVDDVNAMIKSILSPGGQ